MSAPTSLDRYPSRQDTEGRPVPRADPVVWGSVDDGPLTDREMSAFHRDGYLTRHATIGTPTVAALRAELDRVAVDYTDDERVVFDNGSRVVRSVFGALELSEVAREVATSPRVLDVAEQILGGPVYLHQSRINAMPPFTGRGFSWHSDFETWHCEDGLPAMRAVSCLIALTENVPYNGPLLVMPGTHRVFYPCAGATPPDNYRKSLVEQQIGVPSQRTLAKAVETAGIDMFLGRPGDALWFDCNLLHGSGSNISPFARSNLYLVFNSVDNPPGPPFAGTEPRPECLAARTVEPLTRSEG